MEVEGVAPNMMAGEGVPSITPNKSGDDFPQITPAITPNKSGDVFPLITPAIIPTVVPTTIVREVLTEGNYEYWKTCVKRYLVGQGLWEVCRMSCKSPNKAQDPVAYSEWKKKNSVALHAIQISCSREMLSQIRGIKLAKHAWDFLKRNANPTLYFDEEVDRLDEQPPPAAASTGNADFSQYEKFEQALDRGSWNDIESFLHSNPDAVRARISPTGLTPLHVAALAGHVKVVEKLVDELNPEDLEEKEGLLGCTPLALAASDGITEIAQSMIRKNRTLANILDGDKILPVVLACNRGKREMTRFLYFHTGHEELAPEKGKNGATLLSYCIASKFLDIALDILEKYPSLAVTLDIDGLIPLYVLGQTPSLFKSGSQLWFWQHWIYLCVTVNVDRASDWVRVNVVDDNTHARDVRNNTETVLHQLMHGLVSYPLKLLGIKSIRAQKLRHAQAVKLLQGICTELRNIKPDRVLGYRVHQAVIQAVKQGNVEFVTGMIKSIPELVWNGDINDRNIFSIAILNRQEKIFNLLHGLTNVKKMKVTSADDRFDNNMLHLAAMLAPSDQLDGISGAALQMQRELQWFKEVESIVPPICKDVLNSDGKKPSEVFSQQHANLVKEGEKWMKEIATSSSFVAALIVTIMFAAAFTIPGGNNDKGAPIFLDDPLFMVFIISDSISLFSATTSVLMFLGILTSQYAENKFLTRLPTKLIIGLSALFISIAAMMIAFCAALAILLMQSSTKVVMIPIILLACVPVTLFALLQFPLLVNIFISTYGPGIFDRNIQRWY
ncbi:uncharacterized protein LOC117927588 isoform X2 [Vitis riparia]|nr:uncharacterized protein LOC117927588 isoform X2 [Vitis riparia]